MSIRTKLLLAASLLLAALIGSMLSVRAYTLSMEASIKLTREAELVEIAAGIVALKSSEIERFVVDYSYWDDMVEFIGAPSDEWAKENLLVSLETFDLDIVYLFDAQLRPVPLPVETAEAQRTPTLPVSEEQLRALVRRGPLVRFFVWSEGRVLEIHGASVHPTDDPERKTPARGFLFAARRWTAERVEEVGGLVGGTMEVRPAADLPEVSGPLFEYRAAVPLPGLDDRPVAVASFLTRSLGLERLHSTAWWYLAVGACFGIVLLLLVVWLVHHWVAGPLRVISLALSRKSAEPVAHLSRRRDELGTVAALIESGFAKDREIERQYEERQRILEEKLVLEGQLVQAQKMESIGRFAGGIAHDFNNLLCVIVGYVDSVLLDTPEDSATREDLLCIRRAGDKAGELTSQLLAFSRKQALKVRRLNLNESLSSLLRILRRVIGDSIRVQESLGQGLWPVMADAAQIDQVLMNLSVNARDAMPGGGTLLLETRNLILDAETASRRGLPGGRYAQLRVSDTGHGISPQDLSKVFEPFFTTKGPGHGTGLGLSVVYGIVTQLGGAIDVESVPGEGTTFTLLLPAASATASEAPARESVAPAQAARRRVLVVDDQQDIVQLVARALRRVSYEVVCASSAAEAIAAFEESQDTVDLLVTDVLMAEVDGAELARRLLERQPSLRVLFMSGYTDALLTSELSASSSLLVKPFSHKALLEAVRQALDEDGTAST